MVRPCDRRERLDGPTFCVHKITNRPPQGHLMSCLYDMPIGGGGRATPMPIVFANPWMLLTLAAAGVPLIIHLISRQRARKLPISTLRFLLQTDRRTARKHKLVDILVLILRTALLVFLALALSKPFLQPRRAAGDLAPAETAWAIVLDDSYSMGLVRDGLTVLDRAVAAATDILQSIPEGDEIQFVLSSGRKPEGLSASTYRSATVIEALHRLDGPSYGDAPMASALEQGLRFLEEAKHPNRALVVISDFQETALREAIEAMASRKDLPKATALYWLDIGHEPEGNTAVQSVRLYQAMPFVGLPMSVRAAVVNYGDKPARQTVSLWIGRSKIESQEIEIAADSLSEVEFQHVPLEPGNVVGEVRLEGDPLPADNRRYFCWHVTPRVQVVVIHGGQGEGQRWDDVFFLKSVLEPVVEDAKGGRPSGLRVDYVNDSAASKINWQDCQIAFVVGLDRLQSDLAGKLEQFAKRGGSVIAFGGSSASATRESSPDDPDVALLRVGAGDVRTETFESTGTLTLGQMDEQHPVFRTLSRTAAANLSVIEFYAYRRLSGAALGGTSRPVASYDNSDPFLVERRVGNGRILVFETRCHSDWTNLPIRPLFLPLIYETMKYCVVLQLGLLPDLTPGATLRYTLPEGAKYSRAMVKDTEGRLRSFPLGEGKTDLVVERLEKPGLYHIYFQAGEAETELVAAVNVNPDEGKIVRIADEEVTKKLADARVRVYSSSGVLAGVLRRQREGLPLKSFLLYLAAACFLAECFVANYLIPREQASAAEKAAPSAVTAK